METVSLLNSRTTWWVHLYTVTAQNLGLGTVRVNPHPTLPSSERSLEPISAKRVQFMQPGELTPRSGTTLTGSLTQL